MRALPLLCTGSLVAASRLSRPVACRILVLLPGTEPASSARQKRVLKHWTSREVPAQSFLKAFVSRMTLDGCPPLCKSLGRSQGQGSVLTFRTLESCSALDVKERIIPPCLDSRTASALCTAFFSAVGSGVGISSFTETRARALRGRGPWDGCLSLC